jgi:hypothetical protein
MPDSNSALDIALALMARNIAPLPVPVGKKSPTLKNWPNLVITADNASRYFNGAALNVGMQMGPKSGGLSDVDLDCPEAVKLARYFLPPTGSKYGRPSKRKSHWLYTCSDPAEKAVIKLNDENREVILELRLGGGGKGAQSIAPGSVHPSGEYYAWDDDGPRATVNCSVLHDAIKKIAAATILVRHWPDHAHEAALRIGGLLARSGWNADSISHFIVAIQEVAGVTDQLYIEDNRRTAAGAVEQLANGGNVYGLPMLIEFFGDKPAKQIAKIIGYRGSSDHAVNDQGFETDGNGHLLKSQGNIRLAMELLEVEVRFDAFHSRALISGLEDAGIMSDAKMDKLWLTIDERFSMLPPRDFFHTVVMDAARRDTFHPVRDYLDSLKWDETKRLDSWLITYCGAVDTEYVRAVGPITLIAAVRRVRKPGCKFDEMLVLESHQGTLKSELLAALAVHQEWFSDDLPLNADAKKVIEQLQGKWIVEAAEMSGMRRADVEHLKSLLSRQIDRSRLAYGRNTTEQARECIVIGTTNHPIYLKDLTGNRRFWPVKVIKIDLVAFKRDRDQLWAEASEREKAGESIRLDSALWDSARREQDERTATDPWLDILDDHLGDLKGKLLADDAWEIIGLPKERRTQDQNARIGVIMKSIGFTRKKLRFGSKTRWGYIRGGEEKPNRIIIKSDKDGAVSVASGDDDPGADLKPM